MRKLFACLIGGLLLVATPLWGQPIGIRKGEKVTPAPVTLPEIVRATATEEKGVVLIRVSQRTLRLAGKKGGGPGGRDYLYVWAEGKPYTLGKTVLAFSQAGKPLGQAAVAKALARTALVPCFYVEENDPETPEPVYLGVFREDAVILVIKSKPEQGR
jgi:hypothetical protein